MNLFYRLNDKQRNDLKEIGATIEDKDYSADEIKMLENQVAMHIFGTSKNKVYEESLKLSKTMDIMESCIKEGGHINGKRNTNK